MFFVLFVFYIYFFIGWTDNLIVNSQKHRLLEHTFSNELYKRNDYSDSGASTFENLSFFTIIRTGKNAWNNIKTFIGTFHQLRESSNKIPSLTIYTDMKLDFLQKEESSSWKQVRIFEIKTMEDIAKMKKNSFSFFREVKRKQENDFTNGSIEYKTQIWIETGYAFDPVALDLRRANLLEEASAFKSAFEKGRRIIETVALGCKKLVDKDTGKVVLRTLCDCNYSVNYADEFGLIKFDKLTPGFSCHVDLNSESIKNGATLTETEDYLELSKLNQSKLKKLAIGVPTTSKGFIFKNEPHVLLTALIPSISFTLTKKEISEFQIVVFIAFDKGDLYFENETRRQELKTDMRTILPKELNVFFMRLKPLQRIAMTWNMIFFYARKLVQFDYFYQVNDDLTLLTVGWLSKFRRYLDNNGGIGVIGPSDSFNGFKCSLLTQSFVTKKHFEFFLGLLYPLEFRDWKSDRWLSFVYGPNATFCDERIQARNGAKKTRYKSCVYGEWKVVLERDKNNLRKLLSRKMQ